MRPSLRFLALVVVGWVGVRAMTLGVVPGAEIFRVEPSEAREPPPIVATQFPPIEPVQPAEYYGSASYYGQPPQPWPMRFQPIPVPVYYASAPAMSRVASIPIMPEPAPSFHAPIPPLEQWSLAQVALPPLQPRQSTVALPAQSPPVPLARRAFDRVQLSAWALLRGQQGMGFGPPSLASGGQLGGSQAGARLVYNFTPRIAASLRTTSDVGRRGAEVAGGVRIQPVGQVPLWFTLERRQRISQCCTGRNAFALFAESGVYQRPLPWDFELDAYLQAGVVGFRNRDAFIDGSMTFTRPVYRQFSAGLGLWGGAQPGVYRVDAGPRLTMKVRNSVRVHFDWRQRLGGNALPDSGPAITLAGDF